MPSTAGGQTQCRRGRRCAVKGRSISHKLQRALAPAIASHSLLLAPPPTGPSLHKVHTDWPRHRRVRQSYPPWCLARLVWPKVSSILSPPCAWCFWAETRGSSHISHPLLPGHPLGSRQPANRPAHQPRDSDKAREISYIKPPSLGSTPTASTRLAFPPHTGQSIQLPSLLHKTI